MTPEVCAYCEEAPAMDGALLCEDCDYLIADTESQDEMERIEQNDGSQEICPVCEFGYVGSDGQFYECGAES